MRRDFLVLKSRRIYSLENLNENFIKFQLLDSIIYFWYLPMFSIVDRFICFWKVKNRAALNRVRRVSASSPILVYMQSPTWLEKYQISTLKVDFKNSNSNCIYSELIGSIYEIGSLKWNAIMLIFVLNYNLHMQINLAMYFIRAMISLCRHFL